MDLYELKDYTLYKTLPYRLQSTSTRQRNLKDAIDKRETPMTEKGVNNCYSMTLYENVHHYELQDKIRTIIRETPDDPHQFKAVLKLVRESDLYNSQLTTLDKMESDYKWALNYVRTLQNQCELVNTKRSYFRGG